VQERPIVAPERLPDALQGGQNEHTGAIPSNWLGAERSPVGAAVEGDMEHGCCNYGVYHRRFPGEYADTPGQDALTNTLQVELFGCTPISKAWDVLQMQAHCLRKSRFSIVQASINVFIDMILLVYPLPLLRIMKINIKQRSMPPIRLFVLRPANLYCSRACCDILGWHRAPHCEYHATMRDCNGGDAERSDLVGGRHQLELGVGTCLVADRGGCGHRRRVSP